MKGGAYTAVATHRSHDRYSVTLVRNRHIPTRSRAWIGLSLYSFKRPERRAADTVGSYGAAEVRIIPRCA